MTHFVFCHGFGFDIHFWDRLAPYFSQESCSFIDLGYFNKPIAISCPNLQRQKTVGIGHSLGLLKLIDMQQNFDYLIGLNSFTNFLGTELTLRKKRQRELNALQYNFIKTPISALQNFYIRCGVSEFIDYANFSDLNQELILIDLEFLRKSRNLPAVPTLVLSSTTDIIIPAAITSDNFSDQPTVELSNISGAGHNLGFRKPSEIYERTMRFLDKKIGIKSG